MTAIGDGIARLDGPEKVTGQARLSTRRTSTSRVRRTPCSSELASLPAD
jgi:hypothetical protein